MSCKNENVESDYFKGNRVSLIKNDSIFFELDSISTSRNSSSQIIKVEDDYYFSFLNKKNNSIYFYDLSSSDLKKQIILDVNGKDAIGKLSNYYWLNKDSIFLYSYGSAKFTIIDSEGFVKKSYHIENGISAVRPEIDSSRPLFRFGNKIGFNCWGSEKEYYNNSYFNENAFMFFDLENEEKDYRISYPDVYKGAIWGVQFFQFYHEYNKIDSLLVLSFPIDNDLTIYDLKNNQLRRVSSEVGRRINVEPLSYKAGKINPDIINEVKHQMRQDYYSFIKFDSTNNIYIRVLNKKFKDNYIDSFSGLTSVFGEYSLVFLDRDFNFIDSIDLPNNQYFLTSLFFIDGKLYLEKIQNYDEDLLVFDVFDFSGLQ
ncbi:uncharacterized protein DUF4221 [Algoriphagus boseongensis]|uniref:Uncharacterized protein DUF4221 n=2 Tax=Algoriphagus boseongensis TaxID=1442587 RepID=A0A4R6T3L4_9BACT|nr:uncharacterized protein DUF4221 [Algoriphagus boseongensis]